VHDLWNLVRYPHSSQNAAIFEVLANHSVIELAEKNTDTDIEDDNSGSDE
jgi:hypothetical protein